jgi:hypothetical protein
MKREELEQIIEKQKEKYLAHLHDNKKLVQEYIREDIPNMLEMYNYFKKELKQYLFYVTINDRYKYK